MRGYVDFNLADPLPDGTVVSELSIRMTAESRAVIGVPERSLAGNVKDRVRFQRSAPVRTDDPAGLAGLKDLLAGATPFYVSLTTNIGALKGMALRISGGPVEPAASDDGVWKEVDESSFAPKWRAGVVPPRFYRTFQLDTNAFTRSLRRAPMEFTPAAPADRTSPVTIAIPMPDGQFSRFRIEESPVMEPALAGQFPNFKTYRGKGIDDPTATMRFDWTPEGLHAIILLPGETVYVEPAGPGDPEHYNSYYQKDSAPGLIHIDRSRPDAIREERQIREEPQNPLASNVSGSSNVGSSVTLRTYRLAVATTKGFTESTLYGGGGNGVAARNATLVNVGQMVNIMNALYERDLAIHFNLIANELNAIFDGGATPSNADPGYTDGDSGTMLTQNQGFLDAAVGNGNYDIGHVLGLSPSSGSAGGIATLGVVCASTLKASAATVMGIKSVTGNFNADVQVLDHEVGHQFNAAHTTNSTAGFCASERNPSTAYEAGSGSTIMANAGTCDPENILRQGPDNYFHGNSLDLMNAYASAGGACFAASQPGNTAPTVTAPANVTIPMNTPFTLNATSSDAEGDSLTFNWEEFDAGASSPPLGDQGTQALFRSVAPNATSSRTFPAWTYILNNANQPPATIPCPDFSFSNCIPGEILPITNRTLHFRVTARDNHAGAGGVANSTVQVTSTTTAGPFQVTQPNTAVSWQGGTNQTVTWSVAGTTSAPVSAANVKISLSTDGGVTFPTVLAASVPNNGSAQVGIPNSPTTTARIKVEAVGNIFFDVSDVNFTITAAANNPVLVVAKSHQGNFTQGQQNATYTVTVTNNGGAATNGTTVTVTDTMPGGETLVSMSGNGWTCPGTQANNCTRTSVLPAGQSYLPITVTVNVLASATSPQLNSVSVAGGGSIVGNNTDSTVITPAPAITPTPPSLTFTALQGGAPPAGQSIGVAVSNAQPGGTITATVNLGTITGSGSSFTATIAAGATSSAATVNVVLNQGFLPLGTYNGSVTLHATGAPDVTVPVTGSFNVAAVVSAVSVTPNSGSGAGPQVFKAVYSDTSGAADLQVMYLDFGSVGDAPHDCKVAFAQGANALYLFNDANTAALGPITLGGGGSLSNSQCTLFGGATAATPSGNNLTVPFTIQFLAGYGGPKNIFGEAQSYNGAKSANGVFQVLGTWTPATSTPGVVSVSPNSGSGAGPQVFTAVYSDTGGANDLQAVYLNFGSVGFAAHNCIAVYVPGPNALYLFTDDNSNAVGPIAEGAGGGSISNSQCTLTSGGTPATLSGTNLTVPFNITFKSGYGGKKTIFGLAQTYAAVQSNGGVLTSLGNWEPALTTPSAVSVSPSSGSGFGPTMFSATYSDSGGANDLQVVYLSFGGSFLASHSCNVGYQPGNNQLLLFSDDNSTAATVGENGAGSVSNSQCTLSGGSTAAIISGTSATVPFSITFKAGFTGAKNVFGLAQSYDGTQSTITTLGSWTP